MNKLLKGFGVVVTLGVMSIPSFAATPKTKKPGEICYYFNSAGLLGEWDEQLLVSKKKLTYKQAAAYMQKNHGMSDQYDIEELDEIDCDDAVVSYSYQPGYLFYYKDSTTKAKPKSTANQPKKASLSK